MLNVIRITPLDLLCACGISSAIALCGCSSVENALSSDKVDYKHAAAKTPPLDVPPDLTQLARDSRYQPQAGQVSAAAIQNGAKNTQAVTVASVAPKSSGDLHIERGSNAQRWLVTNLSPEQLWPQVRGFWAENGFSLVLEQPDLGIMETDWAENRTSLPGDLIRNTIGKLFEGLYSSGQRDKYRTRIERTATGSEIYITHRGVVEVSNSANRVTDTGTTWQVRPADPELEAEFLSRLMIKLGGNGPAQAAAASSAPVSTGAPARARLVTGAPGVLQVDEEFDRAWRRVGVSLDRAGFTVEDRDRKNGVYFVRYVDPSQSGAAEPGFFTKLFSSKSANENALARYRIQVKGEGATSTVSVLNDKGSPETSDVAKRIAGLLVDDLK